jgi:hypothetical protein
MVATATGGQRQCECQRSGGCGCAKKREHGDLAFEWFTLECRSACRASSMNEELAWGVSSEIFESNKKTGSDPVFKQFPKLGV